jgi:acetylornithine deacetylase
MRVFVKGPHRAGLERAIVCEPTNLHVGIRHRGFIAFEVSFSGPGGHSSKADTLPAPLATLSRLAVAYDDWGRNHRTVGPPGFPGMCVNIAKLDGGIAFNVIPALATLLVSIRPPPGADSAAIEGELEAIARAVAPEGTFRFLRRNAPFATRDLPSFAPFLGERTKAPIDLGFWTEAALLVAAEVDAVVMGTGDIAQAHSPDEWVSIEELGRARALFRAIFEASAKR